MDVELDGSLPCGAFRRLISLRFHSDMTPNQPETFVFNVFGYVESSYRFAQSRLVVEPGTPAAVDAEYLGAAPAPVAPEVKASGGVTATLAALALGRRWRLNVSAAPAERNELRVEQIRLGRGGDEALVTIVVLPDRQASNRGARR